MLIQASPMLEIPQTHSLEVVLEGAVKGLGQLVEASSLESMGYTERLANWVEWMGLEEGLGKSEVQALRWGAYLYDLGKLTQNLHLYFRLQVYAGEPLERGCRFPVR